ncbi:hypothetical protein [Aliiroseovarius marinus]|uniref:hypothetical protein n=1 Tax=Aliiroseovarius marinus TaxID=2500159 RepID=UPI003D7D3DEC
MTGPDRAVAAWTSLQPVRAAILSLVEPEMILFFLFGGAGNVFQGDDGNDRLILIGGTGSIDGGEGDDFVKLEYG